MDRIGELVDQIEIARGDVLDCVSALDDAAAYWKPHEASWCVAEVVEHLVHAEHFGIRGSGWSLSSHKPVRCPNRSIRIRSIDEIFSALPELLQAPSAAVPVNGGAPFHYWVAQLEGNRRLQERLVEMLRGSDLERIIFPHVLVGPLNGRQRLQFFRWHLERHHKQVIRLVAEAATSG